MKKTSYWILGFTILLISYFLHPVQTKVMYVQPKEKGQEINIEKAKKTYDNQDIVGYLHIPSTNIAYFVTQSANNTFYLTHDLKKQESIFGTVFMDYRNHEGDVQINLYGHNGNHPQAPFYTLEKYKEKSFYETHPTIEFILENKRKIYDIVYVVTTTEEEHMNLEKSFPQKKAFYENNLVYETSLSIEKEDTILVLQTCTYQPQKAFLLVIAKERKEDKI